MPGRRMVVASTKVLREVAESTTGPPRRATSRATATRSSGFAERMCFARPLRDTAQRRLAVDDLTELDVVLLAHALEPVEPVGAVRRDGCEARHGHEAFVAVCGAGEDVRPAARDPPARVTVERECVGDRGQVGHAVDDRAARRPASSRRSRAGRSRSGESLARAPVRRGARRSGPPTATRAE